MNLFVRNVAVFHVFAIIAMFTWICGGTRADLLVPVVPWFLLMLLCGMLFFPQARRDESLVDARIRVWRGISRDPLTWISVAFVALLAIPFVNKGLCPICDYQTVAAAADIDPSMKFTDYLDWLHTSPAAIDPPVKFLPYCVDLRDHYGVFQWFVPALAAMIAAKHSLLKRGKRMLLEVMVWNAVGLAVLGFVQQASGAQSPFWAGEPLPGYFFSAWGYPNMAGDYFTFHFVVAAGLWQYRIAQVANAPRAHEFDSIKGPKHPVMQAHYMLLPILILFIAALDTLSRAAIVLSIGLFFVVFLHVFFGYFGKATKAGRLKMCIFGAISIVVVSFLAITFAPTDLKNEASTITTDAVFQRVGGKGQYHQRVAMAILRDHLAFGVGGWGYKHLCQSYMTPAELKQMQVVGGVNVHDDYIQFSCEHGLVGAFMLLAVVALLVWPVIHAWKRFYNWALFAPPNKAPARPLALYCMPPAVIGVLLGCIATLIHSFGDCAMRCPAVLTTLFVSLACTDGFFPRER